jgi:TrmH family RNA methyltransferase
MVLRMTQAKITSVQNTRIKWLRSLQGSSRERRQAHAFIVEGVRLLEEALAVDWPTRLVLYTDELSSRGQELLAEYVRRGVETISVSPHVLAAASDTETPQGILAVLAEKSLPMPPQVDFVFVPDGVRDPGNLGGMLRTAAAAGVQVVLFPPGSVDAFAPKVLRAGMGAHFRLPLLEMDWQGIRDLFVSHGLTACLAEADGEQEYTAVDMRRPLAIIVGGEAQGAGEAARQVADVRLRIAMPGGSESLNAGVAAAVLLFEVVRQRSLRLLPVEGGD